MDTLISNATVVTMNERMDILFGGYIGITGGKITYLSKEVPEEKPVQIVDGTGMVAIPGLVNAHTHLTTTALRNYLDDAEPREALEILLQKSAKLDAEGAKAASLLGIAECLRFGITSVSDLGEFPEAVAEAAAQSGIRANIALAANRFADATEEFDFEEDPQCQTLCRLADTYHGYDNGRLRIDAGIYAEYTGNHPLWEALAAYAKEKGLGMQLHLAETEGEAESCRERTGLDPAVLLDCHGLFCVPATATGCVALTEEERSILAKGKATAVTTPVAYAKAGKPVLNISDTVKAGINVALGTGGAVECGNLDLFETMRTTVLAQRAGEANPMPASAALMMATVCGARAQGRAETTGMLKEGMDADIVLVDFSAPHLMPCHNVLTSLVFSAKGGDVAMTMVGGKILYQNGQFPTISLQEVLKTLTETTIPKMFSDDKGEDYGGQ